MSFWKKKEEPVTAETITKKVETTLADHGFRDKDWEEALIEIDKALALDPNYHPAYILLGVHAQQKGQLDKMDEYFFKALEVSGPKLDEYTWDWVVITLDDGMKDYERFVRYVEKAMMKEPDEFSYRQYLATILWKKLDRFNDAMNVVEEFLKTHPDEKQALKFKEKMMKKRFK